MRHTILLKAVELFLNLGFKSVTMDDIAKELGISKKTIYAHFSTKTKLVEAASIHIFESISTGIDKISAQKLNVIEETYAIKEFAMKHLKNEQSSPQYQLKKYYPKIAELLRSKQFCVMQDCVLENLKRGIETGVYRPDIPINFVSRIYFIGITGIRDNDIFNTPEFSVPQVMENYLEYHMRAIVSKKGLDTLNQFINKPTLQN